MRGPGAFAALIVALTRPLSLALAAAVPWLAYPAPLPWFMPVIMAVLLLRLPGAALVTGVIAAVAGRGMGVWHQVLNDGRLDLGLLFGEVPDVARGLRIWLVIYLIDLVWTACELISPPRRQSWWKLRAIAPDGD